MYTTEPSYWSQWESEGMCTESCGGGTIIQRRFCSHPEMECEGPDYRTSREYEIAF